VLKGKIGVKVPTKINLDMTYREYIKFLDREGDNLVINEDEIIDIKLDDKEKSRKKRILGGQLKTILTKL
jgi:hypothetical protein